MGKGSAIILLCRTIHPLKKITNKNLNMDRRHKLKTAVVIHREKKTICQKRAECIVFTHQDFSNGDAQIKLYGLEIWCRITIEGDGKIFFSDG